MSIVVSSVALEGAFNCGVLFKKKKNNRSDIFIITIFTLLYFSSFMNWE